jgi:putative N6-adenine-specific DNA methylase
LTALRLIATCARGLEAVVAAELTALGLAPGAPEVGGVPFAGDARGAVRACWRLRAANRVLLELARFPAPDDRALYAALHHLAASPASGPLSLAALLDPARTLAVTATSTRSALRDTRWIALRAKDALVDAQRSRAGRRSDVDRDHPDLAFRVRLRDDDATLLLDLAGVPLDHRGYRVTSTAAPLREQLAAAALLASGWDGRGPVVDLMCGSGTFLAEAGAIALGLAPNRLRPEWAFERLPPFAGLLAAVRAEPIPALDPEIRLLGNDLDPAALAAAGDNLAVAGLIDRVTLVQGDAFAFEPPPGPGLVVANPPYGERLAEPESLWGRLGDLLKQRYAGWRAVLLAGDPALGKRLGLRPARRIPVWNGPLEARIVVLELWRGGAA